MHHIENEGDTLQTDLIEAQKFLEHLDHNATDWTFQTFDDDSDRKDKRLVRTLHGTLDQHAETLTRLNRQGAGVFVTVNKTDLKGRKASNITEVRAAFVDLDGAPVEPVREWEQPHILVQTSPGRWHCYWLIDGLPKDDFSDLQRGLIRAFDADKSVHDLPRVMRLPGFWHRKGEPFQARVIDTGAFPVPFTPNEFKGKVDALQPEPEPQDDPLFRIDTGSYTGASDGPTQGEVAEALTYIDPDALDYREWLGVLMGIHNEFGGSGEAIAEEWSARGAKHKPRDVSDRFKGFTPGGRTTIKVVFHLAAQNGCDLSALAKKHRGRKRTPPRTPRGTPGGNPQHPNRSRSQRIPSLWGSPVATARRCGSITTRAAGLNGTRITGARTGRRGRSSIAEKWRARPRSMLSPKRLPRRDVHRSRAGSRGSRGPIRSTR
jgi:hypothetical protein